MMTTYDMIQRLIELKQQAGQLDDTYVNYLMGLLDLYLMAGRITPEQYQDVFVQLQGLLTVHEVI